MTKTVLKVKKGKLSKTAEAEIPSYPSGVELIRGEAGKMYLDLKDMTYLEVGYKYGLDRFYASENSMKGAVGKCIQFVLENPNRYEISNEKILEVEAATRKRSAVAVQAERGTTVREKRDLGKIKGINDLVTNARDLAAELVLTKLRQLNGSKSALKKESIVSLAKVMGILVDKGQILRGEATQNIAVLSRHIKSDISPEEAIKAIIETREVNQSEKEGE